MDVTISKYHSTQYEVRLRYLFHNKYFHNIYYDILKNDTKTCTNCTLGLLNHDRVLNVAICAEKR